MKEPKTFNSYMVAAEAVSKPVFSGVKNPYIWGGGAPIAGC